MAGSRALLTQLVLLLGTMLSVQADTTVHVVFGNHLVSMHSYHCRASCRPCICHLTNMPLSFLSNNELRLVNLHYGCHISLRALLVWQDIGG
jgi:hypothetical protein